MKRLPTFALAALMAATLPGARAALCGQDAPSAQVAAHFRAGQRDLSWGRLEDATKEFQTVLRIEPGLSAARINLGLTYHLLGDYKQASVELRKGLAQSPNVLGANIVLGIDEVKLGSPGEAIEPLTRALRLDPRNQQAMRTLASARLAEGNFLEATRAYRAVFHLEDNGADRWLGLGTAYLQMSNQLATLLSHRYGETAWAYRAAGDLLGDRQLWSRAARQYQLALALDHAQVGLHASLGDADLEEGKLPEAEREYQGEIKMNSSNPHALLGLTGIALQRGDASAALKYVSQIDQASPGFLAAEWDNPLLSMPPATAAALVQQLANYQNDLARQTRLGTHFLLGELYRAAGDANRASQQRAAFEQGLTGRAERQELHPCEVN
ncbi:MAG: tetratricopeptide repeat protein, partial [Terriglobia bacterium]